MKFKCTKNTILQEISIAHEIISSKSALSILSNVLLEAENNTLTIKATDLKVSFETKIPVEVSLPGSFTVFCDKLLGILRLLPEEEIVFETKENDIFIKPEYKKIDFKLKCLSSEKYPEFQDVLEEKYFSLPQKDIIEMISQTVFAVSDDETRYFMNGVFMEIQEDKLIMVSTDGRRLSYISKAIETSIKDIDGVIIPPKILNLIKKLSSGEGVINIAISEKNLFLKFDNQKLTSTLIDGQFPNYNRVIPEEQKHELIISKNNLIEALRRVSLLVENKTKRIYLEFFENNVLLTSEESDIGMASEEVQCTYEGPKIKIALNYLYLSEPLKEIKEEEVSFKFTEANKAISLFSVPKREFFHIIMPMQMD